MVFIFTGKSCSSRRRWQRKKESKKRQQVCCKPSESCWLFRAVRKVDDRVDPLRLRVGIFALLHVLSELDDDRRRTGGNWVGRLDDDLGKGSMLFCGQARGEIDIDPIHPQSHPHPYPHPHYMHTLSAWPWRHTASSTRGIFAYTHTQKNWNQGTASDCNASWHDLHPVRPGSYIRAALPSSSPSPQKKNAISADVSWQQRALGG